MQRGGRPMDVIWTKFNRMVDGSKVTAQRRLCLNALSNHIGRMKKHYEECVKQPRSSDPQPSIASEPQQDTVFDQAPVPVSQPTPAQQASIPLLASSVLILHQRRSVKLTSTVMWCELQQLLKMTRMNRLLSSCMGVACHSPP